MTDGERKALERYLAAERELEKARWALMAAINAAPTPAKSQAAQIGRTPSEDSHPCAGVVIEDTSRG